MKESKGPGIFSIKFRVMGTVVASVLLASIILLLITVPSTKSEIQRINKNYILDLAQVCGEELDNLKLNGYDIFDIEDPATAAVLSNVLGHIKVKGVPSSYAYLVSKDSTMLYHPTPEKIGGKVENSVVKGLVAELEKGIVPKPDAVDYDFKGVTKYAGYYVGSAGDFIIVVTADEEEILATVGEVTNRGINAAVIAVLVCAVFAILMARLITKPIIQVTGMVKKLEDLDFTSDGTEEALNKKKDETGAMSRALTSLRQKLTVVVDNLQKQSANLMEAANDLEKNTTETIDSVGQIEQAVNDIASGATSQANETQMATENVVAIGEMISRTSNEVVALTNEAKEISDASEEATTILEELGEINQKAVESVNIIYDQTNTTNDSAQKIREATILISSIAEETNLLSLNASIEAARAGEQGRGFAVVAAQIQKLAEQSNQSASQIEQIIQLLLSDTAKAVQTMDGVKDIMGEQNQKVESARETFDKVKSKINGSIQSINHISKATDEMQTARENVVDVVQNLTAIAQENAASTEETSASVTEIAAIVGQIAENASGLKNIASELDDNMNQFKL